jgi:hypothetical protein
MHAKTTMANRRPADIGRVDLPFGTLTSRVVQVAAGDALSTIAILASLVAK